MEIGLYGRDEMAASSFAWPSVIVVKNRTIVKCDWSDNFGFLLEKLGINETVAQVLISSNERLIIIN